KAQRRPQYQHARQASDGTRPERVLPQRKIESYSEGTGPRRSGRTRAAEKENRNLWHAQGSSRKGHAGDEAARNDAANVGGIHCLPQLSRLDARRAVEE